MIKKKMLVVGGMLLIWSPFLTLTNNGNQFINYILSDKTLDEDVDGNYEITTSYDINFAGEADSFESTQGIWGFDHPKYSQYAYFKDGKAYFDLNEKTTRVSGNFYVIMEGESHSLSGARVWNEQEKVEFDLEDDESLNVKIGSKNKNNIEIKLNNDQLIISYSLDWEGSSKDKLKIVGIEVPNEKYITISNTWAGKYSLVNDEFNISKTNKNLVSRNYANGQQLEQELKPYFDDNSSYQDIENYIRTNKLLVSRDGIPYEFIDFIFLDSNGNEIDKSEKLGGSEIRLQLVSDGKNERVIGESEVLELEIPYFIVETEHQGLNVYDFVENDEVKDSDPTDNMARGYWVYEGNRWVFKTNQLVSLELDAQEIDKYWVDGDWYNLWGSQRKTFEYEQVVDNESQRFDKTIKLENNDGFIEEFRIEYEAERVRDDDVIVSPLNENDLKVSDEMKGFDGNRNQVIDAEEILKSNVVVSPFAVKTKEEYYAFKWDYQKSEWLQIKDEEAQQEGYVFEETGVYGFSSVDEYGNNSFEVVEFVGSELDSVLVNWDITNSEFALDESLALEQGMNANEYQRKTSHEMRMIDTKRVGDEFIDLKRVAIDNEELGMITNQYQNNKVEFGWMRDELEDEINEQLVSYGLSDDDYVIEWNHNNDEVVTTKMKLSYEIVPSGNWTAKGSYQSEFKALVWNDLSEIQIPEQMLVDKTNDYMVGDEFKRLRKGLESVINQQLKAIGVPTESLEYQWNHSDDELISGDEVISYSVTSEDVVYQGVMSDSFVGESYYGLGKVEIDNDKLVEISLEHEGDVFGDYRELMEAEIVRQLDAKGYPVEFIKIEWGIADSEVVEKNDVVSYQLVSKNERFVRGGYQDEFKWEFVPPSKEDKVKLYVGFAGLILGLFLLTMIVALVQKYKRKKIRKARARVGDQYSRSDALDYLNDKEGDE